MNYSSFTFLGFRPERERVRYGGVAPELCNDVEGSSDSIAVRKQARHDDVLVLVLGHRSPLGVVEGVSNSFDELCSVPFIGNSAANIKRPARTMKPTTESRV